MLKFIILSITFVFFALMSRADIPKQIVDADLKVGKLNVSWRNNDTLDVKIFPGLGKCTLRIESTNGNDLKATASFISETIKSKDNTLHIPIGYSFKIPDEEIKFYLVILDENNQVLLKYLVLRNYR